MNTVYHARASAAKWGGSFGDYLPIHDFIDNSKSSHPDMRHRAMLHSAWGIFLVEKVFGPVYIVGRKEIPTRLIAEQHVLEDLGFIPTMSDWLENMTLQPWMSGAKKKTVKSMAEVLGDKQ
jgi:hypothetical protein